MMYRLCSYTYIYIYIHSAANHLKQHKVHFPTNHLKAVPARFPHLWLVYVFLGHVYDSQSTLQPKPGTSVDHTSLRQILTWCQQRILFWALLGRILSLIGFFPEPVVRSIVSFIDDPLPVRDHVSTVKYMCSANCVHPGPGRMSCPYLY